MENPLQSAVATPAVIKIIKKALLTLLEEKGYDVSVDDVFSSIPALETGVAEVERVSPGSNTNMENKSLLNTVQNKITGMKTSWSQVSSTVVSSSFTDSSITEGSFTDSSFEDNSLTERSLTENSIQESSFTDSAVTFTSSMFTDLNPFFPGSTLEGRISASNAGSTASRLLEALTGQLPQRTAFSETGSTLEPLLGGSTLELSSGESTLEPNWGDSPLNPSWAAKPTLQEPGLKVWEVGPRFLNGGR